MQRPKVSIVEDGVALGDALARALGREYDAVVAHTGGDALALARDDVDLILLDLNLPDLDGIDVAQQLAGHAADIVMLTARSDASNALEVVVSRLLKKLAEAGADGVIDTVRGLGYVVREPRP